MWKTSAIACAVLAGLIFLPAAGRAQDCGQHVRTTEKSLATVRDAARGASEAKRSRIQGFVDDAARVLDSARADCERSQTPLDHSFAIAKVLVAQGNIAAAQLLIKAD